MTCATVADSYCRSDFNNHYYTEGADALQLAKDACTGTNMRLEEEAKERGVDIESLYYNSWAVTTDIKDLCSCITCVYNVIRALIFATRSMWVPSS